jgi:hypothetical protein
MVSCQVKPTTTALVRNSGSAHAERAATNGYAGVEAAETGESDAPERGEGVMCERWDSRRGSVRQILVYRAQRGRVNARQTRIGCNDRISRGNNYSARRPRTEDSTRFPRRSRRHKTKPVRNGLSYLADCKTTISARESFDSPNVWPNKVTLLQDAQKS